MDTKTKLQNFVGGEHVDTADGRLYDLVNPATGEAFAQAPMSGEADVDATRPRASASLPCSSSPTR